MDSTESQGSHFPLSRDRTWWERFVGFSPGRIALFLFYLLFAALLVTRRFDCIQNPQFWAEEGTPFFIQATERPFWINLFSYSYGYFDLLIRLTQQIAAFVPLETAPLVLVLSAIAIQAAVPAFVISSRCAGWMGPFPIRLVAAALYCGMPNSFEVHCIELHSRVHLVVLATLVIISAPVRSFLGKLFDGATLLLAGLSGPFVLLLAPVAMWWHWRTRTPATRHNAVMLGATLAFAIFALVNSIATRFGTSRALLFSKAFASSEGSSRWDCFLAKNLTRPSFTNPTSTSPPA